MRIGNKKIHSPVISLSCIDSLKYAINCLWIYQFVMKYYWTEGNVVKKLKLKFTILANAALRGILQC